VVAVATTTIEAEILQAARKRITPVEQWTQGSLRSRDGAVCALAALIDASRAALGGLDVLALKILKKVTGGCVSDFNDAHTHDEVLAAFDRAVELAEEAAR